MLNLFIKCCPFKISYSVGDLICVAGIQESGCSDDEHIGSGSLHFYEIFGADVSVDLYREIGHLTERGDLAECVFAELLSGKARVDCHYKHSAKSGEYIIQN